MCERPVRSRIPGQYLIHDTKITLEEIIPSCYIYIYIINCCELDIFLLLLQVKKSSSKTPLIVITVIVVMLLSIVAGVMFVKKYVCGGRSVYLSASIIGLSAGNRFSNNLTGL